MLRHNGAFREVCDPSTLRQNYYHVDYSVEIRRSSISVDTRYYIILTGTAAPKTNTFPLRGDNFPFKFVLASSE